MADRETVTSLLNDDGEFANGPESLFLRRVRRGKVLELLGARGVDFRMAERERLVRRGAFVGRQQQLAELDAWFQQEIDREAMRLGLTGSDAYLEQWRWGDLEERPGSPDEVLDAPRLEVQPAPEEWDIVQGTMLRALDAAPLEPFRPHRFMSE